MASLINATTGFDLLPCRFGALYHDWPDSYFKAQASRGDDLVGIFKQAMGAAKAQKAVKQRNILARMFPGAHLATKLGNQVGHTLGCTLQKLSPFFVLLVAMVLGIRSHYQRCVMAHIIANRTYCMMHELASFDIDQIIAKAFCCAQPASSSCLAFGNPMCNDL